MQSEQAWDILVGMWRSANNYLRHALSSNPAGWHPMLAVYYLTYACDFSCPFCSDGSHTPYPKLRSKVLHKERIVELLRTVRRYSDYLVITGGEPLRHPDFGWLLERLPALAYDGIVLTTIGDQVHRHLEGINRAIRYLVFSIETLEPQKADDWFGKGPGMLEHIMGNMERARTLPGRRYEMIVSSVATPDNLPDLIQVYHWAQEHDYRFAVCPQLLGVKPHPDLFGNPDYHKLFDLLIAEKKRGRRVNGTLDYLRKMRNLTQFSCRPSTVLGVSPAGEVFYPCLEIGKVAGNLLEQPDLHALRRRGKELHGSEPQCGNQCHSACALGFASLLANPATLLSELGLMVKSSISSRRS